MIVNQYWTAMENLMKTVQETQFENIQSAGSLIAQAVKRGGCIHICDSGHMLDSELIFRGGGLVLYKRFRYQMMVENPVRKRERTDLDLDMSGMAAYALKSSGARPEDVLIVGSVSGTTFRIVDLAVEAKKMGLTVIALTSLEYARQVLSDHRCGKKLYEIADLTLDNCAPITEGMIQVPGIEAKLCAASGISAAYIMWSVTCVVVDELLKMGIVPGVYKSGNYPGGDTYNRTVIIPTYEEKGY
ncbi:MAG: sugar isomerase domain-containing protein [Eubacteriales bacterium]|nr:sugar isomerase domain-containing protein [Eubacteriales bacterium]